MKKLINKLLLLFVASTFVMACADDQDDLVTLNTDANIVEALSETNVVLEAINADMDALTISWDQPEFGFEAAPVYKVLIDKAGGDFSEAVSASAGTNLELTLTNSQLNGYLIKLGFEQGVAGDVNIKVEGALGSYNSIESGISVLTATSYVDKLDLSTTWGVVGSAANDWGATPDLPFYTTDVNGVLVAYVDLIIGDIKFRENNSWDLNYGDTDADGTLEEGGTDIAVTEAGSYKVTFNQNNLTYTIEAYSWGIVGSAYNDWGVTPDAKLIYDPYSDQFRATVTLLDGDMKIRANEAWDTAYGDLTLDGILDQENENNIAVTAGRYIVTVDFKDLTYSLEPIDNIWGIVGDATPNGWDGPDVEFTRDWSTNDDVWILNGVTLVDGEWKIRANNDWANAYGDIDLDNVLDQVDGNNIAVTAGTSNITLDFSDPDNPTYLIE